MEDLSREELISKNKNLLQLLKKAKFSKDELEKDKEKEIENCRHLEKEKNELFSKSEALEEMVDNLNENKIAMVTKNESLERQINLLQSEVDRITQEKTDVYQHLQISQIDTEKYKKVVETQQRVVEKLKLKSSPDKAMEAETAANLHEALRENEMFRINLEKSKLDVISLTELRESVKILTNEKKAFEIIVSNHKKEISGLEDKLTSSEDEINHLKASNQQLTLSIDGFKKQIRYYDDEITKMKEEHEEIIKNLKDEQVNMLKNGENTSNDELLRQKQIYEEKLSTLENGHSKEIDTLKKLLNESKSNDEFMIQKQMYEEKLSTLENGHSKEIDTLKKQFNESKSNDEFMIQKQMYEGKLSTLENGHSKEIDILKKQLNESKSNDEYLIQKQIYEEKLSTLENGHSKEIDTLKKQLNESKSNDEFLVQKQMYDEKLSTLENGHTKELDILNKQLAQEQTTYEEQLSTLENGHMKELDILKKQLKEDQTAYEEKLSTLDNEHEKELNTLKKQLKEEQTTYEDNISKINKEYGDTLEAVETKLTETIEKLQERESRLEAHSSILKETQDKLENTESLNSALSEVNSLYESQLKEFSDLKIKCCQLEENNNVLRNSLETMEEQSNIVDNSVKYISELFSSQYKESQTTVDHLKIILENCKNVTLISNKLSELNIANKMNNVISYMNSLKEKFNNDSPTLPVLNSFSQMFLLLSNVTQNDKTFSEDKYTSFQNSFTAVQSDISSSFTNLLKYEHECIELTKNSDISKKKIDLLEQKLKESSTTFTQLESELKSVNELPLKLKQMFSVEDLNEDLDNIISKDCDIVEKLSNIYVMILNSLMFNKQLLSDIIGEKDRLEKIIEEKDAQIIHLNEEVKKKEECGKLTEDRVNEFHQVISEKDKEIANYDSEVSKSIEFIDNLRSNNDIQVRQIKEYEMEMSELKNIVDDNNVQINMYKNKMSEFLNENEASLEQICKLKTELEACENNIQCKNDKIVGIQSEIDVCKNKLGETCKLLNEKDEIIESLSNEMHSKEEQIKSLNASATESSKEIVKLREDLTDKQNEIDKVIKKESNYETNINILLSDLKLLSENSFNENLNLIREKICVLISNEDKLSDINNRLDLIKNQYISEDGDILTLLDEKLKIAYSEKQLLGDKISDVSSSINEVSKSVEDVTELDQLRKEFSSKVQKAEESLTKEKAVNGELLEKLRMSESKEISLNENISKLENDVNTYQQNAELTLIKYNELLSDVNSQKETINTYENTIRKLESDGSKLADELELKMKEVMSKQEEIINFENKIEEQTLFIRESNDIKDQKKVLERELQEKTKLIQNLENRVENSSNRCEELLSDINEMNNVLKERGENISKLEDIIRSKNRELDDIKEKSKGLQSKINQEPLKKKVISEEISVLCSKLNNLETENTNLKRELKKIETRHEQSSVSDYHSEVLSTSTFSRDEESQRFKELEDTFEERYTKLKSVAIKLKKQIAEQKNDLLKKEEEKKQLLNEKEVFKSKLKNSHAMQEEIDRFQDALEAKNKSMKENNVQLLASVQQLSETKTKLAAIMEQCEISANALRVSESTVQQLNIQVSSLKDKVSQLEKEQKLKKERIDEMSHKVSCVEAELLLQSNQNKDLKSEIERTKDISKKHSLIDLEIQDYEKRLSESSNQISALEDTVSTMKSQIKNKNETEDVLKAQITLINDKANTEAELADKLRSTNNELRDEVENLEKENRKLKQDIVHEKAIVESMKQDLEKFKINTSELSRNASKSEQTMLKIREVSEKKVLDLEENLCEKEEELTQVKNDYEIIKKEFDGYKLRAQHVLKQKKKFSDEEYIQLQQENEQTENNLKKAETVINQLKCELSSVRAEMGVLKSEKERLSQLSNDSQAELTKLQESSKKEISKLKLTHQKDINHHQEIVDQMSKQTETIEENFKAQIKTMKESHQQEANKLMKQIKDLSSKPKQPVASVDHQEKRHKVKDHHQVEFDKIDFSTIIREDGEGSEYVEPVRYSGYTQPPLEQLINEPFPPENLDELSNAPTEFSSRDYFILESKISSLELRLKQVSTLLSESEGENAKLSQLCDALKEEIRNVSRQEERSKHLQNNEYLKNVFLKFLHLKKGDEKQRLVPVIQTLLQLSPAETSDLLQISADDSRQTEGTWGSYLNLWSTN